MKQPECVFTIYHVSLHETLVTTYIESPAGYYTKMNKDGDEWVCEVVDRSEFASMLSIVMLKED